MVGVFSDTRKSNIIMIIHSLCATGGISLLFLSLGLYWAIWFVVPLMLIGSLMIYKKAKFWIWGVEVLAFVLVILGLGITLKKDKK